MLAEMPPGEFSPDPFPFSRLGVAAWDHPLYIVLGHLLVRAFPSADPLRLVNFVSALFGAGVVALVYLLSYRFTGSTFAACFASFSLAVSHTFWWHSSTPEVYTLFVFLLLVSFYFFDRFEKQEKPSLLMYSALFFGLAAATHMMAFLALPALGLASLVSIMIDGKGLRWPGYPLRKRPSPRLLGLPALGFLAGFSLYLLQFIRMSANFPLDEIIGPVIGSTFLSQLGTLSPLLLGQSLLTYLIFLAVQFGPVGLAFGGIGFRHVFREKDPALRKVVSFFILFALFGIFYRVTDQFTFFIPSYVFWALLMSIGADLVLRRIRGKGRAIMAAVLGLLLLATPFFYTSLPVLAEKYGVNDASIGIPKIGTGVRDGLAYYINPNKRGDAHAYDFGFRTISQLPPGSVVIAEWYTDTDEYFILRYFSSVEPLRPDVTVAGWATRDPFSFDSRLVLDLIEDSLSTHPIYLASLSERFYAASELIERYCVVPENNLYRLYSLKEKAGHLCLGREAVTE